MSPEMILLPLDRREVIVKPFINVIVNYFDPSEVTVLAEVLKRDEGAYTRVCMCEQFI